MKKTWVIWILGILIAVNIAALVTIGYHRFCRYGERHHENRHAQQDFLHGELSLSDDQAEQMKRLKEALISNMKPIRAALRAKREQLVQLLMATEPDHSKIDVLVSEIDSLQSKLQKQVIDHLLQQKQILTDQQQEKFFSVIKDWLLEEESHHQENGFSPRGMP